MRSELSYRRGAQRRSRRPFRSVHGTLNHLLLTDRAWLGRFTEVPFSYSTLADELYSDFDELRSERRKTDDDIDAWAQSLTDSSFEGELRFYSASTEREMAMPRAHCIVHVFNHQTHHRGQLTTLLEQLGSDFGVTDLPRMPGVELSAG
jgi:uncharacterized damage-inducible protein DinB